MNVLYRPYTLKELLEKKDESHYVEGIVPMELSDFIDNDLEGVLDILSEKLIGSPLLMDINYSVVGHEEESTLLIKVVGDVSSELDAEDELDQ